MDTPILSQAKSDMARQRFVQAAVSALERCALYLLGSFQLPSHEARQLAKALHDIRASLELPPPPGPLVDLRDWPADPLAGEALGKLLKRLDVLEEEMRRTQPIPGSEP